MGLGSEIRYPKRTYPWPGPGVKRHRIPDPDPQHCTKGSETDPSRQIPITYALLTITC
jgi:hypothetical protein